MACALCRQERELKNSHIIPEFMYGSLHDEIHRFHLLSGVLILAHDGQYHITNLGVEFLTWMARNGRREDGPF